MSRPLPFQVATTRAVLDAFARPGASGRFLTADEVGLGKTIVAQGVIRGMIDARKDTRPLKVFYICNSLAIAHQNVGRLVEVFDDRERRASALCTVDRLTLMPGKHPQDEDLHLYSLTPTTSLPRRRGQPRKGRKEERALVYALVARTCPALLKHPLNADDDLFRFGVQIKGWNSNVAKAQVHASDEAVKWFKGALRWEFFGGTSAPGCLKSALLGCLDQQGPHELMGRLRNALAAHVLRQVGPDLVIFDEFQRFRDLLAKPSADNEDSIQAQSAARVLRLLRGDDCENVDERPRLLLLSATPYRLLTHRDEDEDGGHHAEFFDVLDFLSGHGAVAAKLRVRATELFRRFRIGLRAGEPDLQARDDLEELLASYVARTERASHELEASVGDAKDRPQDSPVQEEDLKVYRHFVRCLENEGDGSYALPYWTSIPMPAQSMGAHYKAWKGLRASSARRSPPEGVEWSAADHKARRAPAWPHPGLRTVLRELPPERLCLPWLPPSRPWWPSAEGWRRESEHAEKLLVFSRFRAVPPTVAAAISFEVERWVLGTLEDKASKDMDARHFTPGVNREAMLALWYPSPFLVQAVDPSTCSTEEEALSETRKGLRKALAERGITVKGKGAPQAHGAWRALAALDGADTLGHAWRLALEGEHTLGLEALLESWDAAAKQPLETLGQTEFEWLVEHALGAPGIALARALGRHAEPGESPEDTLAHVGLLAWESLRTYLDTPWFRASLRKLTSRADGPSALRAAVVAGNFENVLDEHLWIAHRTGCARGKDLRRSLKRALGLRAGGANFHELEGDEVFRVRCHAALPFTQIRDPSGEGRFRPDELRDAFNSPFWPYVLVTTSVGQEGLDFHLWCRDLLHWDLPSNPVDLEQREGRIRRFGGLAVRRALAAAHGTDSDGRALSWDTIGQLAEAGRPPDDAGLQPWWIHPDATVRRHYLDVPLSERRRHLESLKHRRMLYRLALGQPDQEDLLADLEAQEVSLAQAREWSLELSPWFRQQRRKRAAQVASEAEADSTAADPS